MDVRAGAAFRSPIRFGHVDSPTNGPGVPHYLDGCLLEFVDEGISIISDDPEGGVDIYGAAEDFVRVPAIDFGAASTDVFLPYTLTSGSANAPTVAAKTDVGGVLRIQSSGTADNDSAILKLVQSPFRYSTTKTMWYVCRFALQATATGEALVGLVNTAYSPADPATLPTDGLFFSKATAATDFTFNARKSSTSSSIANVLALAGVTLTADVMVELAFRVDTGSVTVYVNGKKVGVILSSDANLPAAATALQEVELVATSAAATKYMDLDHLLVAEER
jgi:hypothetical protein